MTASATIVALALSLLLAGCDTGPRVGGRLVPDAGDGNGFAAISRRILTPSCALSGCHVGQPPSRAPMSLEEGLAWSSLVGVYATEAPGMMRVAPGDVAGSYLVHKLRGTAGNVGGVATRMPLGKAPLRQEQIREIEAWIARGAPDD